MKAVPGNGSHILGLPGDEHSDTAVGSIIMTG